MIVAIASGAAGQSDTLGAPRLRAIALQSEPPGMLSKPYVEILGTVADAIDHSTLDVAADRFTRFLARQREVGHAASPGYVDYVLRLVAMERNTAAADAANRAAYFNAQEDALLQHLSLLEKQYSDRAGSRLPDFVLREPVLSEYGDGADPVRQGLPQPVNTEQLPDRIAAWRTTLDRVAEQRATAIREFTDAVQSDLELLNRLVEAERRLTERERQFLGHAD